MEIESSFSAPAVAAEATERAIARLLRGTTWQAVTREIAWRAVAAVEGDYELAERVVGLADEMLSELIDGVECRVDSAAVHAWNEHVRWRPHDLEGAELVATIAAAEEAERLVVAAYAETQRLVDETALARREAHDASHRRPRRFFRRARARNAPPPPSVDFGDLGRPRERYGWPGRDAA